MVTFVSFVSQNPEYLVYGSRVQVAAKAQRASVEPGEVARYEAYDAKHGAKYIDPSAEAALDDDDDWGTPA